MCEDVLYEMRNPDGGGTVGPLGNEKRLGTAEGNAI